jgi:hypothetical protein
MIIKIGLTMDRNTFLEKAKDAIIKKWHEQFPEDFICCDTTDKEIYRNCNKYPYKVYCLFLNSYQTLYDGVNYKLSDYYRLTMEDGEIFQIKEQLRCLSDIENSNNIKAWIIDNIDISNNTQNK